MRAGTRQRQGTKKEQYLDAVAKAHASADVRRHVCAFRLHMQMRFSPERKGSALPTQAARLSAAAPRSGAGAATRAHGPTHLRSEVRGVVLPNVARDERRHVLLEPHRVRLEHAAVGDQRAAAIVHEDPERQPVLQSERRRGRGRGRGRGLRVARARTHARTPTTAHASTPAGSAHARARARLRHAAQSAVASVRGRARRTATPWPPPYLLHGRGRSLHGDQIQFVGQSSGVRLVRRLR